MPRHRLLPRILLVAVLAAGSLTVSSCAAMSGGSGAAARNPDVLTASEIESAGAADGTAFDAINRLRPRFLSYHGVSGSSSGDGQLLISIDGGPLTDGSALRTMPARQLAEVRFLSATDAAQRFGTSASSGTVLLIKER